VESFDLTMFDFGEMVSTNPFDLDITNYTATSQTATSLVGGVVTGETTEPIHLQNWDGHIDISFDILATPLDSVAEFRLKMYKEGVDTGNSFFFQISPHQAEPTTQGDLRVGRGAYGFTTTTPYSGTPASVRIYGNVNDTFLMAEAHGSSVSLLNEGIPDFDSLTLECEITENGDQLAITDFGVSYDIEIPSDWWIKEDDGHYFPVKARTYKQGIAINYELQELSSRKYRSIDRGDRTDRYSTKLTFSDNPTYINDLLKVITDLRRAGKSIIMGGINSTIAPFGDHVDYSGEFDTLVEDFGKLSSSKFNTLQNSLTFLATGISYSGISKIPDGLECLSHSYETPAEWNTHMNETIFGNNYFVDHTTDKYIFSGSYTLTNSENSELYNFWRQQRGEVFTVTEEEFGVTNMFGGDFAGETSHNVIILDIKYSPISPNFRSVTVKMVKVEN